MPARQDRTSRGTGRKRPVAPRISWQQRRQFTYPLETRSTSSIEEEGEIFSLSPLITTSAPPRIDNSHELVPESQVYDSSLRALAQFTRTFRRGARGTAPFLERRARTLRRVPSDSLQDGGNCRRRGDQERQSPARRSSGGPRRGHFLKDSDGFAQVAGLAGAAA